MLVNSLRMDQMTLGGRQIKSRGKPERSHIQSIVWLNPVELDKDRMQQLGLFMFISIFEIKTCRIKQMNFQESDLVHGKKIVRT